MIQHFDLDQATQLLKGRSNPSYMYNKRELKIIYDWFMANREKHLEMFSDMVNNLAGSRVWENEYTPASLIKLAEILYPLMKGQFLSDEEYQVLLDNASPIIRDYVYKFELTHSEKILTFLGSVYLGEVIIRSYPEDNLQWELCKLPKSYVYSGHMVINITKTIQACPILTFYPFIHGCLRHLYLDEPQDNDYLYTYFFKITSPLREIRQD
ncbi:MAG: hypothetical protein K2K47_00355 [Duncaniella sp.]|nr:hypothetical protein [Duncaniella sp.]